jgi:hypothetical protein
VSGHPRVWVLQCLGKDCGCGRFLTQNGLPKTFASRAEAQAMQRGEGRFSDMRVVELVPAKRKASGR